MSNNDHTARPENWETVQQWADSVPACDCLMELRARVERLEQAQQQPEPTFTSEEVERIQAPWSYLASEKELQQPIPSTPAGQGELVRCVANAAARARCDGPYEPEQAAILAVADWLDRMGREFSAALLRDEVGR
jgi:hypothetical protein